MLLIQIMMESGESEEHTAILGNLSFFREAPYSKDARDKKKNPFKEKAKIFRSAFDEAPAKGGVP